MTDIQFTVENGVGIITLNRPKALNALTLDMIHSMFAQLIEWQADDAISWVLVQSSSPKAFCAGGDVRALYDLQNDIKAGQAYFVDEYRLNHLTHHYAKPYVALMDGIVMGGGMGISQGAGLKIVSEASRLAMPETAIGLVPDVGGSYFLSRAGDSPAIGRYLAVTSSIISAKDACRWGLADVMVSQPIWTHMVHDLIACPEPSLANLRAIAQSYTRDDLHSVYDDMSEFEAIILEVFEEKNDLDAVQKCLKAYEQHAEFGEWAKHTLSQIAYNSPVAMHLALHNQARGRESSLANCLRIEFDSITHLLTLGEGQEGIRAKIVDKDQQPNWRKDVLSAFNVVKTPLDVSNHPLQFE